ncbi:MAG: AmmeMemoRadiSam system protein B [Candidatus Falkowbacteria bacterium]|nr:AmmeMemoRadiSam system protein B [Candidatus Falkowbacteria bacterium]
MITSAYILPHSPLLIPSIGKENILRISETERAVSAIVLEIANDKPDIIFIITSHGIELENSFAINLAMEYNLNFEEFGDFTNQKILYPDLELINSIKQRLESTNLLKFLTRSKLNHAMSVPLYYVLQKYTNFKIVPIHTAKVDLRAHYDFGKMLKPMLIESDKKITIITSGELSHRLSENSPTGYLPQAKKFDQKVIQYILDKATDKLFKMDEAQIEKMHECGLKPSCLLLGILDQYNFTPSSLSYEKPFGVGHFVAKMEM